MRYRQPLVAGRRVMLGRTAFLVGGRPLAWLPVVVWINGTHGSGKTTTQALVQGTHPGLTSARRRESRRDPHGHQSRACPARTTSSTGRRGVRSWFEARHLRITSLHRRHVGHTDDGAGRGSTGARSARVSHTMPIPVRHFVLHADQDTLRARIQSDPVMGPFSVSPRAPRPHEAAHTWLHDQAEVIDTSDIAPDQAASPHRERTDPERSSGRSGRPLSQPPAA